MSDIGTAEEAAFTLSPETAFKTGMLLLKGRYARDTAFIFVKSAAERKNTEAQRKIVEMYLKGEGVRANTVTAAALFLEYGEENLILAHDIYKKLKAESESPSPSTTFLSPAWEAAQNKEITETLSRLEIYIASRAGVDLRQVHKDGLTQEPT